MKYQTATFMPIPSPSLTSAFLRNGIMVLRLFYLRAYPPDTDFALLDVRVRHLHTTVLIGTLRLIPYGLLSAPISPSVCTWSGNSIASLWVEDSGSSSTSEPGSANTEDTVTRRTVTMVSTMAGAISFSIFMTYNLYPFAAIIQSLSWGYYRHPYPCR